MLESTWQSPSNIAIVKYWGKKGNQLPANTSFSFTLSNCKTITTLKLIKKTNSLTSFDIFVDSNKNESFKPKVETFFTKIHSYFPELFQYKLEINTHNTFPHSSGIASSASSFSALSLCICDIYEKLTNTKYNDFTQYASFISRIGSGSACRSLFNQASIWGRHSSISSSSDEYGINASNYLGSDFQKYKDIVLLIESGKKSVSSTVGHSLLNNHPFASNRYDVAQKNITELLHALQNNDVEKFIAITESEALMLHALMMTSNPYFILFKPNTIAVIQEIINFRKHNAIPVCFTLDAGANVHLLYPIKYEVNVLEFVENTLANYCEEKKYICDELGIGATKIIL